MIERKFLTLGYEGLTLDRFIEAVKSAEVSTLVDVRARAQSRKRGFSKNALQAALSAVGIEYVHLKSLGDPKEGRDAARAGRMFDFETIFVAAMKADSALDSLAELIRISNNGPTCLLCYERNPQLCHRSLILSLIANTSVVDQIDILVNEKSIAYKTTRRMPYTHQSVAA